MSQLSSALRRLGSAGLRRGLWLPLVLGTMASVGPCAGPEPKPPDPVPPLRPADVVKNLQLAYKRRDNVQYTKLLASDFQFWFDPATRPDNVPEFWTRLQDSTGTANLFAAGDVSDIRIDLTFGSDVPTNIVGQERWRRIRVTDTFLEVDKVPLTGEVITLRVDGDTQDFYVRQGLSPGDTLAGSPTAKQWYLVEWHDLARLSALKANGDAPTASEATSWTRIKSIFR